MTAQPTNPLPASPQEVQDRGWKDVDIVLVTGDAYVDHPSFGIALIGRILEREGYRVAILSQPRLDDLSDFRQFGPPRLFFGITGGNLDSIVANYSSNGKVRDFDAFSPRGNPWRTARRTKDNRRRPDRAVLQYAQAVRTAFPGITIIIGGVEASLRRFVHYDYKQNSIRGSQLTDAKADLLLYGMAETSIREAAERIAQGKEPNDLPGSCIRLNDSEMERFRHQQEAGGVGLIELPSYESIRSHPDQFLRAELEIDRHARSRSMAVLAQRQQAMWVVQFPAPPPLETDQMDEIYRFPFSRKPHPSTPDVPAYTMIKDSITIVRGCPGNCSFCAISRHQGPSVTSRSIDAIVEEAETLSKNAEFRGTISDLGGPTANLFGTSCRIGSCKHHDCLYPEVCKNLEINERHFIKLLDAVQNIDGVEHVFISSGLRMELLRQAPQLMRRIIDKHTPGALKIAPEHTEKKVLELMHKEPHRHLVAFLKAFRNLSHELGVRRSITPYIISAHPGCTEQDTARMVQKLKKLGLAVRKFQDFTPTPGTISTAMYVSKADRDTGRPIAIADSDRERTGQRRIIEKNFLPKSSGKRMKRKKRSK